MYILMIARGVPSKYHPQWGCFEKDQAEALAAYGHKVVVLSVDARFKQHRGRIGLHRSCCNGVEYYNYVMIPGVFISKLIGQNRYRQNVRFRYVDKLYKQIVAEHGKPDIIYSQFFFNTIFGVLLKQKYHIPLVGIEHLSRFNDGTITKDIDTGATIAFNGVDTLVTVSKALANNIEKRYKVKSTVVYNTVGKEFLGNKKTTKDNENFVFVATGSLIKRKGFDLLLAAFAQSKLYEQGCILKIIGVGPEKNALLMQIQELGIGNNVTLTGRKDKKEIAQIMSDSHVFVLSSRSETFGVVCIEALAVGLPNIATICGGPEEFMTASDGILIQTENVDALADAMRIIYQNYDSYNSEEIAENCRKRFSPEVIAAQLTDVFENVLKKQSVAK